MTKKKTTEAHKMCSDYKIVRTRDAGVFAGTVFAFIPAEGRVQLRNARRLWYWDGAASLSQLAMEGTKAPRSCKFPCEVDEVTLLGVIEILSCTEAARASIAAVPVWAR